MVTETVIPGDGYCIINSIIHCMRQQKMKVIPSRDGLLQMLEYEILKHIEYYKDFVHVEDDFVGQLERYIKKASYGSDIVDLILYSAGNCLGLKINLYQLYENHYTLFNLQSVVPQRSQVLGEIDIVKRRDHLNSILIKG